MRVLWTGVLVALTIPTAAFAQEPRWEVGTRFGVTRLWTGDRGDTDFSLPGSGVYGEPTLHASYFFNPGDGSAPPKSYLDLELGLTKRFSGSGGFLLLAGLQGGYYFNGASQKTPYAGVDVALIGGDGSDQVALGGALGYRLPVTSSFAVRFQANYRRWLDLELNELTGAVILGAVFH